MAMIRSLLPLLLALLCASAPAADANLPAGIARGPILGGVSEYRLGNGMRVVLAPDQSASGIFTRLVYQVGAADEGPGEGGMAALLQRLTRKASLKYPHPLADMQARGLWLNGSYSDADATVQAAKFSPREGELDWYLGFCADAMRHAQLTARSIAEERLILRNGRTAQEQYHAGVLESRAMSVAFRRHAYGRDPLAAQDDLDAVSPERLQAFYRRYYRPDNAVLIIVGKFDVARALASIASSFGRLSRPPRVIERTPAREPAQDGERQLTLHDVDGARYLVALYHAPAASHPDATTLQLLANIIGGGPGSRLHQRLVMSGMATQVSAEVVLRRDPGVLRIGVRPAEGANLDSLRSVLYEVLDEAASHAVTQDELNQARERWQTGDANLAADRDAYADALAQASARGDWRLVWLAREVVRKATPASVQGVAAAYLVPDNRTLALYEPVRSVRTAALPERGNLEALLADLREEGAKTVAAQFEPTEENIDAHTQRARLANGMRLILLPKTDSKGFVQVVLNLPYGTVESLAGRGVAGRALDSLFCRETETLGEAELDAAFNGLQIERNKYGEAGSLSLWLRIPSDQLDSGLRLLAKCMRETKLSEEGLRRVKLRYQTWLAEVAATPAFHAYLAMQRHRNAYAPEDARYLASAEEDRKAWEALRLNDVQTLYADFLGADHALMALVGDFDADHVTRLLGELFGDWHSRREYRRLPEPYHDIPPATWRFDLPGAGNGELIAELQLPMRDTDADFPALWAAIRLLGSGPGCGFWSDSGEAGTRYSMNGGLVASAFEAQANFNLHVIVAASEAASDALLREQIERLRKNGFPASALAKIQATWPTWLDRDDALAQTLIANEEKGRDMRYHADFRRKVQALTLAEVNAAFRKYIDPEKLLVAIIAPPAAKPHQ